ncbi:MAG: fused MFS/spermidine synthase [Candidatus Rokubacteria bacterium]|nr:fused MFS/spermidine synthase [Candidatus Rokubacteria bacterium]
MTWYFVVFAASGFASLVYEVVWLRLAMAAFGVTTPLVSTVLSVFMAGLALGSWAGGRLARRLATAGPALRAYGLSEAVIAVGSLLVPVALGWGRAVLLHDRLAIAWDSTAYHVASGVWVAIALLPFCVAMGATVPFALAAIRSERAAGAQRAFSYLYLANVAGATAGTLVTALVLVELLGFRRTLLVAGASNAVLAVAALVRSLRVAAVPGEAPARRRAVLDTAALAPIGGDHAGGRGPGVGILVGLTLTGLTSLAMEVVWLRQFAPYLGPDVYTFASVLATYLVATTLGSRFYRALASSRAMTARLAVVTWLVVGALSLLPLVAADPRVPLSGGMRLILGIVPFSVAVAVLTPMLVDRWSAGAPDRAGSAYALNVVGSILGPLLAGFLLLPTLGERGALLVLALPLFGVAVVVAARPSLLASGTALTTRLRVTFLALAVVAGLAIGGFSRGWEATVSGRVVRHDHTATVVAGGTGQTKRLFVNGYAATSLTPVTKWMAHLPLAHLSRPPENALVICFGMGTTFRSALAWGIHVTAVDLVPSVPSLFAFFHPDAPAVLAGGRGRIVIDDGRRFLERSASRWDVIIVDPPPPVEAAASSLLYSREFYEAVRRRLAPDGIVQQWVPFSEPQTVVSIARVLDEAFPHVRVFPAIDPVSEYPVGVHFLASARSLPTLGGEALAARLPAAARADLVEWTSDMSPTAVFDWILRRERSLDVFIRLAPWMPPLEDDRPFNEYYLVRRWLGWQG